MRQTRDARPEFIAREAATRVVERMRSTPLKTVFESWWKSAETIDVDGVKYAVGGTPEFDDPNDGVLHGLDSAFEASIMLRPSRFPDAPLRVHFLTEGEYSDLWGLLDPVDLNFDGSIEPLGGEPAESYRLFPVVVEVHWRDPGGDNVYQLKAVVSNTMQLDPRARGFE
jgi:hypothetical protein